MKNTHILLLIFMTFLRPLAFSQHYLLIEKPGKIKHFLYKTGDPILLKTSLNKKTLVGEINTIDPAFLVIGYDQKVDLDKIHAVLKPNFFPPLFSHLTRAAGIGYFVIDVVNNLINGDRVFVPETMIISTGLVGVSFLFNPFRNRKLEIGKPWRINILVYPGKTD